MKTQYQHYYESARKLSDQDQTFMELIKDKTAPMTNAELIKLIEKRPNVYGRYSVFIGKLSD